MNTVFKNSVVGGTFDRFHKGHRLLLQQAFLQSQQVTIGVSTEQLLTKKQLASLIEPFSKRETYVREYINDNKFDKKVQIVPIDTIYGTTLSQENIDAIFITEDTIQSAELINKKRIEKGWSPLEIVTVPLVKADDTDVISSERIRKGEIDREGLVYRSLFKQLVLELPKELRHELRKPIGVTTKEITEFTEDIKKASMTIAVGDIVSFTLAKVKNQADISLIDFKTRRHELKDDEMQLLSALSASGINCMNEAGKIQPQAVEVLRQAIDTFIKTGEKKVLTINGEEDLLTLPAILLAPLESIVIYGQFGEGAVSVRVTEQKKDEIARLLKSFKQITS